MSKNRCPELVPARIDGCQPVVVHFFSVLVTDFIDC